MMYDRDTLLRDLRSNVIEVHFTKTDGSNRVMKCTLQTKYLPESFTKSLEEQAQEKDFHQRNPEVLAVWDIENNGWRSFRIDSVTYCQLLDSFY